MKWLGVWFAIGLMIEVIPSSMVQGNAVASSVFEAFGVSPAITGVILAIVVGLVVIGGIKRIGQVSEKLVPFMALLYLAGALIVVILNFSRIPEMFSLIFSYAFQPMAPVGGFAGAGIAAAIRWGFARGVYSNEAGLGTAPIAHATATTDHPVRQGLWSMVGVVIDTLVIATGTAFVVLSSGVWKNPGALDNPSALPALAFAEYLGQFGQLLVTVSLLLFVISTIIVLIYYGEKQAEFLFGLKFSKIMKYVYVISIFIGAIGGAKVLWQFLDITLAAIAFPNLVAILLLSKQVAELKNEFFSSEKYYLKEIRKDSSNIPL